MNWSAVTSAITALTAVGALVFTAQSLNATRDQVALAEQGQITDRYTKAIDQIGTQGPEHLQTRLGGVYALERLARDSPRDQPTIVEVLSAFIRGGLPQPTQGSFVAAGCPAQTSLSLDTRAALTVLGRRDHDKDQSTNTDLQSTCLGGADLRGMNLTGAVLIGADLVGAFFANANLTNAKLNNAKLDGAKLGFANLTDASLVNASLVGADLVTADLTGASLDGANLTHADLADANLSRAVLYGADLTGADLTHAKLSGANLGSVTHPGAKTDGATKDGAVGAWW
ncbi:pentapeptide repeat-containing protein [Solihabitans fulvus]|uniref:Pentapeptide repeat-containing protein n=1 Tax=Solihabitans fulvus TaxID=1892852 RepID=A0A5B2XKH8_9PSEU|nr:pentapeptide repeat-containing protein [Solihabitans fulvus]KAA2263469.1 pentapeptide repeat-containing protein [Solihabitans fulvus]